jgi:hypothetical protein
MELLKFGDEQVGVAQYPGRVALNSASIILSRSRISLSSMPPQMEIRRGLPPHLGGNAALLVPPARNAVLRHGVPSRHPHARFRRSSSLKSSILPSGEVGFATTAGEGRRELRLRVLVVVLYGLLFRSVAGEDPLGIPTETEAGTIGVHNQPRP